MKSYNIIPFNPHTTSDEVWDNFYEFNKNIWLELFPDDPPTPKERLKKTLIDANPRYNFFRWLTFVEEVVIGYSYFLISKKSHPAYETNKHVAEGEILIDKHHRRKGIGAKILKLFVQKAKENQRSVFQSWTDDESGHQFCKKFGGTVAFEASENRLEMTRVDWGMMKEWQEEGPKRAEGVTLERFNEVADNDIEEYCILYSETMNQAPQGEIEGRVKETPETRRNNEERLKSRNGIWTTMISREKNDSISGLTEVFYFPDTPSILYQELTGVNERYRGRGLGKWLKAEMLMWIKDEYPKVKKIVTGNATTNAPMLSINNRMGYKEYKSGVVYKFKIDELAEILKQSKIG